MFQEDEAGQQYVIPCSSQLKDIALVAKKWLMMQLTSALQTGFGIRFECDDDGQGKYQVVPSGLLAAMWWAFSKEVTGQASYRACRICSKIIEISSDEGGRYRNSVFCGNACKQRDYRVKIAQAKQKFSGGETPAAIAKALGTTVKVVKGWIKEE